MPGELVPGNLQYMGQIHRLPCENDHLRNGQPPALTLLGVEFQRFGEENHEINCGGICETQAYPCVHDQLRIKVGY